MVQICQLWSGKDLVHARADDEAAELRLDAAPPPFRLREKMTLLTTFMKAASSLTSGGERCMGCGVGHDDLRRGCRFVARDQGFNLVESVRLEEHAYERGVRVRG